MTYKASASILEGSFRRRSCQFVWVGIFTHRIAKEHGGIMRFIQVSCLGASPSSPSRLLKAKAAAKVAVLREFPEYITHKEIGLQNDKLYKVSLAPCANL
ncbi:hypothetical protein I3843_15G147600 [Carya illinoinensis]|nr:hypothetical protein I3843_15G147600 [Carya illinoinensis]